MTAVQTRPPEAEIDLSPWQCPGCGHANQGIRGFCAGCSRPRPAAEPEPAVRQSAVPPEQKPSTRPLRARPLAKPPAPPSPPAPRTGPTFGPREIVATICIVVLFVGGVLAAVVRSENTSSTSTSATPAPAGGTSATKWDPRVLDIVQFVERRRGLQFKHPVPMDFLDDAAFDKKVTSSGSPSGGQQSELNDSLATLRAVGLAEGSPDLQQAEDKVASQSILGLYSPKAKHVFVRGSNLTPDVRVVLAHELTHALQDQYFGLDRLGDDNSGADTAFRALAEADAVRVEDSYVDSLSSADAKAFEATRSQQAKDADIPDVPEALIDDLSFPYVFGPAFVAALEDRGGNDAVDAAFRKPPQSEAQIVDPQSYLDGVTVTKVPAPTLKSGQKRIEKPHDVGQVSMLEVLGDRLPYDQAWGALKPWTGDQGLTYRENGTVCFAGDTALKDPASADNFETAARAWAATMPAASVARVNPTVVDLRSCDPGPAYRHAVPQPSAFKTLALRSELIAELQKAGLKYVLATCATDRVIAQVGSGPLLALDDVTDENDPRVVQVQRVTRQAVATCQRSTTT
jgi:hypothetical protein